MSVRFWIFIGLFLGGFQFLSGQTIMPPTIEYVSVNPATGRVFIQWMPSATDSIDGYIISDYGYYTVGGTQILAVPPSQSISFDYPDVSKRPVIFTMNTTKKGKLSGFSEPKHRPVYLSSVTDSCAHTITLKWTKYIGWGDSIKGYRINYLHDGFQIDSLGSRPATDTTFIITNYDVNKSYNYYISAIRNDGIFSNSNKDSVFVPGARIPDFITAEQATMITDHMAEVRFLLDVTSDVKNYQLTKSSDSTSGFQVIRKYLNYTSNSLTITDSTNQTTYYRLELLNSCDRAVKFSNIATAIFPNVTVSSGDIVVQWPAYGSWPKGVRTYDVYRYNNDTPEWIGTTTQTSYSDNINALMGKKMTGSICYSVEALENSGSHSSKSAKKCIDLDLSIFIPQGFTPNDDGINDVFVPFFAFLPSDYSFVVFNRFGFKVFESKDPLKGWDGTLGNGRKATDGVYVYFITYKSSSGKTIERSGNFSLIYP
jgi:gliding motility-associated-like protein